MTTADTTPSTWKKRPSSSTTTPSWREDWDCYPKSNDRGQLISLIDRCLQEEKDCPSSSTPLGGGGGRPRLRPLSDSERRKLLNRYFPKFAVNIFCARKEAETSPLIAAGECCDSSESEVDKVVSSSKPLSSSPKYDYAIPHDELLEALQIAPTLVVEETPLERYLNHIRGSDTTQDKQGAVQQAALKIAMHWKMRKLFFHERAYLPMAQTTAATSSSTDGSSAGDCDFQGALFPEDVEWLKTGCSCILPSTADPKHHRCVAVQAPVRLPPYHRSSVHYDRIKLRLFFYMHYLHSRNPATQKNGLVVISACNSVPSPYFSCWSCAIIREAFPVKQVELRVLFLPSQILSNLLLPCNQNTDSGGGGKQLLSVVVMAARLLVAWISSYFVGTQYHFGYSDESVAHKLVKSGGLNIEDMPTWIGGQWGVDKFHEWQTAQVQNEIKKYTKERFLRKANSFNRKKSSVVASKVIMDGKQANVTGIEKERSKERRVKARLELEHLQGQVHDLKVEGARIRDENDRLENLLKYAKQESYVLIGLESEVHILNEGNQEGVALLSSSSLPFFDQQHEALGSAAMGHLPKPENEGGKRDETEEHEEDSRIDVITHISVNIDDLDLLSEDECDTSANLQL